MTVKTIFAKSRRQVFRNYKFVLLFWFTNSAVAFVISLSIYFLLIGHLEYSLVSDKIAEGFNHIWLLQFFNNYKNNLADIPFVIYGLVGIYTLVQTFYSGGLISIFQYPKKNHMVDFFYGGVKYWWRFVKIVLIALLLYALAFLINDLFGYLITLAFKNTELELADFLLRSLRYLLLVFFILIISILTDYSKVALALNNELSLFNGIKEAALLIKNEFLKTVGIFLLISVIGMSFGVVYNVLGKFIPRTPSYFLILAFLLQQVLIIFRLLIRMFFYSTEVLIFSDINAEFIETDVQKVEVKV